MFILSKTLELVFEKSIHLNIWIWNIIKKKTFDVNNLTKNFMDFANDSDDWSIYVSRQPNLSPLRH
jgi:hypothetical protein